MKSITSFFAHLRSCRGQQHWKGPCSSLNSHLGLFICLFMISFYSSLHFCIKLEVHCSFTTSVPPLPRFSYCRFLSASLFILFLIWMTGCTKEKKSSAAKTSFLVFWQSEALNPLICFLAFLIIKKQYFWHKHVTNQVVYCLHYISFTFLFQHF